MDSLIRIGKAAERLGVCTRTLKRLEPYMEVSATMSPGGRMFDWETLRRVPALTAARAAQRLGVRACTVWRLVRRGELHGARLHPGARMRFSLIELDRVRRLRAA